MERPTITSGLADLVAIASALAAAVFWLKTRKSSRKAEDAKNAANLATVAAEGHASRAALAQELLAALAAKKAGAPPWKVRARGNGVFALINNCPETVYDVKVEFGRNGKTSEPMMRPKDEIAIWTENWYNASRRIEVTWSLQPDGPPHDPWRGVMPVS